MARNGRVYFFDNLLSTPNGSRNCYPYEVILQVSHHRRGPFHYRPSDYRKQRSLITSKYVPHTCQSQPMNLSIRFTVPFRVLRTLFSLPSSRPSLSSFSDLVKNTLHHWSFSTDVQSTVQERNGTDRLPFLSLLCDR